MTVLRGFSSKIFRYSSSARFLDIFCNFGQSKCSIPCDSGTLIPKFKKRVSATAIFLFFSTNVPSLMLDNLYSPTVRTVLTHLKLSLSKSIFDSNNVASSEFFSSVILSKRFFRLIFSFVPIQGSTDQNQSVLGPR